MKPVLGLSGYARVGKDEVASIIEELEPGIHKRPFADKVREMGEKLNVYLPEVGFTYNDYLEHCGGYEKAKGSHPCIREHLVRIGHGGRTTLWESIWADGVLPDPSGLGVLIRTCPGAEFKLDPNRLMAFANELNPFFPGLGQDWRSLGVHPGAFQGILGDFHVDTEVRPFMVNLEQTVYLLVKGNWMSNRWHSANYTCQNVDLVKDITIDGVVIPDVRYDNESCRIREGYNGEVWMIERPGVGPSNETEAESIPKVKYDRLITNDGSLEDLRKQVTKCYCNMLESNELKY